jgi:hypothetical protein
VAEAGLHQGQQRIAQEPGRQQPQGNPAAGMLGQGLQRPAATGRPDGGRLPDPRGGQRDPSGQIPDHQVDGGAGGQPGP